MKRSYFLAPTAALVVAALAQTGCSTEAYCWDCGSTGGSAGTTATASAATGTGGDGSLFDAGSGEGGGTTGATTGAGGAANPCGKDLKNDIANCGACDNVCNIPNAFPVCKDGFCQIQECAPGWIDLNMQVANGCEYACTPSNGGVEICDGVDNDCNGQIDELTDTKTDPLNCGACNQVCSFSHASPICADSKCVMGPCFVGYFDVDGVDTDGCEFACTPTNGGVEVCDNKDNNCNTQVDEGFDLTTDAQNCGSCGTNCSAFFPHSVGVCSTGVCAFGPCLAGYYNLDGIAANGCEYACTPTNGGVEICDGLDNDCDGAKDEGALAGVGVVCGTSAIGECKLGVTQCTTGAIVCAGGVSPVAEVCDNKDNNCSGVSDEGCPKAVATTERRLDIGTNSAVGQAPSTQLSVIGRGDLFLATYVDRRSGNADVRATVSLDGGLSWLATSDVGVATGSKTQVEPAAMLGLTSAYVSYGQFNSTTDRDVYVARSVPPFSAFTSVRVDKDTNDADTFFIRSAVVQTGAPDKIVVVWESLSGTGANVTTDVFLQASVNGGVTWKTTDLRVNSVVGVAELPVIATDGAGHAFIAWRDQRAAKAEVYADVYDVNTGTLSGNKKISGGFPGQAITIAADAGGPNVYVAWTDLRATKKAIRVNRSTNTGAAFAADGTIVNPDSTFADADAPAIISKTGNVVVAWEDTRNGLADIRVNHSVNAGASWLPQTSRVDLGSAPGVAASTQPSLAFGSGNVVLVVWQDARNGKGGDIYGSHSFDAGTTFQPIDLRLDGGTAGAADSRSPLALSNAAGTRGVAVWVDYRTTAGITGVNADIYSNFLQFP